MLDAFSHFTPPGVLERFGALAPSMPSLAAFKKLQPLWDLDARLAGLAEFPGLQQILNMGNPPVEVFGPPEVAADLAREANESLAAISDKHPDTFPAFTAVVPMNDVDRAMAEIDDAVLRLGARGLQLYTNVNGAPLSAPEFRPVFARMAELDLPILVHPFRGPTASDYASEELSQHEIWFTFGWPYESTAFAARMVYSGIFRDFPSIKIVLHHMGAMIPMFGNRIDLGFEQIFAGPGGSNPVADRAGVQGPLSEHFQHFYADTAVNGSAAGVRCGYDFFGAKHSLFGTDAPFSPDGGASFISGTLSAIDALGLSAAARDDVLDGNARRLFRLPARESNAVGAP